MNREFLDPSGRIGRTAEPFAAWRKSLLHSAVSDALFADERPASTPLPRRAPSVSALVQTRWTGNRRSALWNVCG